MDFLSLKNVSYTYSSSTNNAYKALKDISFSLNKGEYLVVTGANGSGKSTLARLIAGFLPVQTGTISGTAYRSKTFLDTKSLQQSVPSGIVFQDANNHIVSHLVHRDTAFGPANLCLEKTLQNERVKNSLSLVGLLQDWNSSPQTLSSGQKQKLALAGILALLPELIILDETFAMIDIQARAHLLKFLDELNARGTTIICITHQVDEAMRGKRIIFLQNGKIDFDGKASDFFAKNNFFNTPLFAPQKNYSQKNCANEQASFTVDVRGKALSLICDKICFAYNDKKTILQNASFALKKGTINALVGASGTGKSTLLQVLAGLLAKQKGRVFAKTRPVLVQQECANALFEEFVADDVAFGAMQQGKTGKDLLQCVKNAMELCALPFDDFANKRIAELSGGQKRKVAIAGIVALDADVYLFDEPTAGLDSASKQSIFALFNNLCANGKTVLFSTHRQEESCLADFVIDINAIQGECVQTESAPAQNDCAQNNSEQNNLPLKNICNANDPAQINLAQNNLQEWHAKQKSALLKNLSGANLFVPQNTNTFLHRMTALAKYLLFFALFILGVAVQNLPFLIATSLVAMIYPLCARISAKKLFITLLKVLPYLLFFIICQFFLMPASLTDKVFFSYGFFVITDAKLLLALKTLLHYVCVLCALLGFLATATESDILDGMASLLKPLEKFHLPVRHIVLLVAIVFRFVPLLQEEAVSIIKAQIVRMQDEPAKSAQKGARKKGCAKTCTKARKKPFETVRTLVPIIVPLIIRTLRRAEQFADALIARYYH